MVNRFSVGDRVRVDIPDTTDPDFEYHREHGVVTAIKEDAAGYATGDERDSVLYRVELESGEEMDFRWRDLRPSDTEV
ncbi:hypothetical protein [Halopiger aswanensis]|nr:hypothetical protein [Halopiger aswanensis]